MPDQRSRSLTILAQFQAALGAAVAVSVFAFYALAPSLVNPQLSLAAAVLGALAAVYFVSLHQLLKKTRLALSTLLLSIITVLNSILLITSTGGLDSPYYSLWLLAIVTAGLFGRAETIGLLGVTVAYNAYDLLKVGFKAPSLRDHLIQLGITLTAAALAEWVHSRSRRANAATSKLEKISGQLSTEQLKADAIMSSIGEGVMVIDGMRRIQLFNKAAQELTGWDEVSAQNIEYNLVMQLKTADDQAMNEFNDPFIDSWKKRSQVVHDDLVTTTRNGRKIQLNLSISPIFDANQAPSGAIALFRDISEEKEVERQKDEFVSTASHEMRTPVAAIEGYISLAMNANVATIDDRAKQYLEKAHDTIIHLGQLFRDLLSVTKAEEGKLTGHIEAVNLERLVQSAVDDMQFTIQKKNITLVYQKSDQTGKVVAPLFYVAASPERLREVVMNLIDNAYKFTTEGGIKVVLDGNDKEVTVGVSDSGVGIAAEDIGHLFQKFYRIDSTATRTIGGTGLGLYLCRRLIETFNGRIWVESKPGEGSTFKFTLPRLTDVEITKLHAASASAPDAGLVVPLPDATPPRPPAAIPMPIPTVDGVSSVDATGAAPVAAARTKSTGISRRIH